MSAEHRPQPTMERFLRAELSRQETREVVRHLLARCPRCVEAAVAAAAGPGFRFAVTRGEATPQSAPDCYDAPFANVARRIEQMEERRLYEQRDAAELWAILEEHPQQRRLLMIHNDRRFVSLPLHERLLARGREIERQDPAKAAEIAELALAIAERLAPSSHGVERVVESRAAARAALDEARRLGSDLCAAGDVGVRHGWSEPQRSHR